MSYILIHNYLIPLLYIEKQLYETFPTPILWLFNNASFCTRSKNSKRYSSTT